MIRAKMITNSNNTVQPARTTTSSQLCSKRVSIELQMESKDTFIESGSSAKKNLA